MAVTPTILMDSMAAGQAGLTAAPCIVAQEAVRHLNNVHLQTATLWAEMAAQAAPAVLLTAVEAVTGNGLKRSKPVPSPIRTGTGGMAGNTVTTTLTAIPGHITTTIMATSRITGNTAVMVAPYTVKTRVRRNSSTAPSPTTIPTVVSAV